MGIIKLYNKTSLVLRIVIGLIIGLALGIISKEYNLLPFLGDSKELKFISILGTLFVGALKAIAPILVFVLVVSSLANAKKKLDSRFGTVIILYIISTFLASIVGVLGSFIFPQTISLAQPAANEAAPSGIGEVFENLLTGMFRNPVTAVAEGQYISILFWAVIFGLAAKKIATENTKQTLSDISDIVAQLVRWIINLAPFGIMGLVYNNVYANGLSIFVDYGKLLALLCGCMLTVALVIDPLLAAIVLKTNPYPLVFKCLKESGITAFFTRSSAANIPVNMALCEKLGLDRDMYSVSIPLGATINMDGAAITISVMALAAAHTTGVSVSFFAALLLAFLSTLAACGASGVAGGSLLLIPMACSVFGVHADVAMQVVAVGFIISVVQDSLETALNSSGDVMFAATAEYARWKKEGKSLPKFLGGDTEI
ncbi:MAG TPA: serine/threonine transporter SstT [Ruminococcaceae bacterium]|nr:serine/threonine transporter SstT [Oscillospiraceae bacterium]